MRAERSKSAHDVPQRVVFSALWELPFGKAGSALKRHAIGGWQLNAIQTIERRHAHRARRYDRRRRQPAQRRPRRAGEAGEAHA